MVRNLQNIKTENPLRFRFLLEEKLKKVDSENEASFEKISKTEM